MISGDELGVDYVRLPPLLPLVPLLRHSGDREPDGSEASPLNGEREREREREIFYKSAVIFVSN